MMFCLDNRKWYKLSTLNEGELQVKGRKEGGTIDQLRAGKKTAGKNTASISGDVVSIGSYRTSIATGLFCKDHHSKLEPLRGKLPKLTGQRLQYAVAMEKKKIYSLKKDSFRVRISFELGSDFPAVAICNGFFLRYLEISRVGMGQASAEKCKTSLSESLNCFGAKVQS